MILQRQFQTKNSLKFDSCIHRKFGVLVVLTIFGEQDAYQSANRFVEGVCIGDFESALMPIDLDRPFPDRRFHQVFPVMASLGGDCQKP